MKKIFQISAILFGCLCLAQLSYGQESLRDRLAKKQAQQQGGSQQSVTVPQLTVRAQKMNESQGQDLSNATWVREVYRFLDLTKGKNAALQYPVQPINNKMNLYTLIFKLMGDGNLIAYDFNNGQDVFTDDKIVNFKDVLERLEIPYQQNGVTFSYDEFSIPSNEVLGYYIKEAWYFDQSNSVVGVKTVAICPILFREEFMDGVELSSDVPAMRQPQFWVPYENIRPYAARMPIITSDLNNVQNKTVDDYFRMRLYDGEIYKTTNMENKILAEKYKTPEELKAAQEQIEKELVGFEKNLWVANDSINTNTTANNKTSNKKQKAPKASKPKNSGGSASFSARDRR